jgi:putative DNA primase/helicase
LGDEHVTAREYVALREGRGARVTKLADGSTNVTCPGHEDRTPSLHVSQGDDGNVGLHCYAGCETADVLAADGLDWPDLFANGGNRNGRVEVAVYRYTDEQGRPLFEVGRFEPKAFFQRRPGRDDWKGGIKGVRRVLYRLPQVLAAVEAGAPVYVVEGERDVHALERAGVVATCNPMGAGKWRGEYAESLRGALVAVVADRDEPGREHARAVARSLAGVAISVEIVEAAVGKDASDHVAAGKTVEEFVALDVAGGVSGVKGSVGRDTLTPPVERLRVLDVDKMLSTSPPPVPWVVEPILARGCVTMLAGREGRGKSMLALALAAGVGRATTLLDIAGMPVGLSGHVLYVDAENGENEAWRRVNGLDVARGTLTYVEANAFDLKQHLDDLDRLVSNCEPKLLVLDSLRSLAPGLDENDSLQAEAALRPVVRLTQRLDIATLILHHASRASGEYRGSTAIGAAVELGFTLTRLDDDPMAATRRKLSCWKSRPAAEPDTRWLSIKPTVSGDILLIEAAPYEPPTRAPVRDEIEDALRKLIGGVSGAIPPIGDDTLTPPGESPGLTGDLGVSPP